MSNFLLDNFFHCEYLQLRFYITSMCLILGLLLYLNLFPINQILNRDIRYSKHSFRTRENRRNVFHWHNGDVKLFPLIVLEPLLCDGWFVRMTTHQKSIAGLVPNLWHSSSYNRITNEELRPLQPFHYLKGIIDIGLNSIRK